MFYNVRMRRRPSSHYDDNRDRYRDDDGRDDRYRPSYHSTPVYHDDNHR